MGALTGWLVDRNDPFLLAVKKDISKYLTSGFRAEPRLDFSCLDMLIWKFNCFSGLTKTFWCLLLQPITFALVYVGTTLKDLSDVTHGWSDVSKTRWVRTYLSYEYYLITPIAFLLLVLDYEDGIVQLIRVWNILI